MDTELLTLPGNYFLLGDPGAGKTTTLKRLAHHILSTSPSSDTDAWAYPVVVVLRDHDWSNATLLGVIGAALGLDLATQDTRDHVASSAEQLITQYLDAGPAILLLDGLDEVPHTERPRVEKEVTLLADHLSTAKVVVSCRSGDYNHLDGFSLAEILPLTPGQVKEVADRWLGDSSGFFQQLDDSPASDLVNRPLFLAHMLTVYQNGGGSIPYQPSALQRQIVRLMLQFWDEQRRIVRRSMYGNFHVEDKLEFLSALSFELTVSRRASRFSSEQLEEMYSKLAPRFGLPDGDAALVAQEIETHTGIIVQSGTGFEFSHLSLQEYLCGYYIVRQPFNRAVVEYIYEHPAPVAVAVALSSNPSLWLANAVLRADNSFGSWATMVGGFVNRIVQERPRFTRDINLGYALVKLMMLYGDHGPAPWQALSSIDAVAESLSLAVQKYRIRRDGAAVRLDFEGWETGGREYAVRTGYIDTEVFDAAFG